MTEINGVTSLGVLQGAKLSKLDADNHAKLIAWIQDVALGIQKQQHPDGIGSLSKEQRVQIEYDTTVEAVQQYTTWVSLADDSVEQISRQSHTGSIDLSKLMEAAVSLYAGIEGLQAFKEFNTLVGNTANVGVTDFMNFWWNHVDHTESGTSLKFGPAFYNSNGMIQFTVVFYHWTFHIDDWRSLFVESDFQSFDSLFLGKTFSYSAEEWAEYGPAIERRLDAKVTATTKVAPLGI